MTKFEIVSCIFLFLKISVGVKQNNHNGYGLESKTRLHASSGQKHHGLQTGGKEFIQYLMTDGRYTGNTLFI